MAKNAEQRIAKAAETLSNNPNDQRAAEVLRGLLHEKNGTFTKKQ